ncbi:hypothetical protein F3Y22_tig00111758pilonHSYRG00265 [Hibiscus syriacus]|uniref:Uncharacterized protein n=1 Tax=Hibiscus syriacus TaxID=106335 RepID=A0A6A2YGB8_HIBSY|nr:hypothetical protein F3Y22_tig00111758pilonHSYRG00265 [Hibiscus syriacus]
MAVESKKILISSCCETSSRLTFEVEPSWKNNEAESHHKIVRVLLPEARGSEPVGRRLFEFYSLKQEGANPKEGQLLILDLSGAKSEQTRSNGRPKEELNPLKAQFKPSDPVVLSSKPLVHVKS